MLLAFTASGFATSYTVAGSDATLFGYSWDPARVANDMTQYGESVWYSWRKTGVALSAGTIEFKVTVDHDWGESYPVENYSLSIPENGTYDVTIIFNSTTHDVKVSLSSDTWIAAGDSRVFGTNWDIEDDGNAMTTTDGVTYTLTKTGVTLAPGIGYEYKVVKNKSWENENYGKDGGNAENKTFTVAADGVYDVTITFNYATKALSEEITLKQAITYKYRVKEKTGESKWTDLGEMTTVTEGANADKEATLTVTRTFDAASTVYFKVAKQLYYGEVYQSEEWLTGGNEGTDWHATIDVAKASKYDLTFNVYFSTAAIYGSAVEQFTGYNLITNEGAEDSWIKGDALTESEGVYGITFSKPGKLFAIAPNTAFDASDNITWSQVVRPVTGGDDWAVNYFVNYSGSTESAEDGKVWSVTVGNESNLTLAYTPAASTFSITTDATEDVEIGTTGYATYSNDLKYQVENATANFVTVAGSVATLVPLEASAVLPNKAVTNAAGKNGGIILTGTPNSTAIIKPVFADAAIVDGVSANLMAGSGNSTYDISGDFGGSTYTGYILANHDSVLGFYKVSDDNTLAAHKAFLAVPDATAPSFIGFGADVTGINEVKGSGLKVQDAVVYDLQGRRVITPARGLYIVNGRKVIIK